MCSHPAGGSAVEPLFVGGHPAIDFLNTRFSPQGRQVEIIGDGDSLLAWLVRVGLLNESTVVGLKRRLGTQRLDALAAEARTVREWAGSWILRWSLSPGGNFDSELCRLNELLQKGSYHREVIRKAGRWELRDQIRAHDENDLLALIAMQLASLVTAENPALMKRCASTECTLWFLDRTKGHRRMFCSAAACGNRAKVAAFRARQRSRGVAP